MGEAGGGERKINLPELLNFWQNVTILYAQRKIRNYGKLLFYEVCY